MYYEIVWDLLHNDVSKIKSGGRVYEHSFWLESLVFMGAAEGMNLFLWWGYGPGGPTPCQRGSISKRLCPVWDNHKGSGVILSALLWVLGGWQNAAVRDYLLHRANYRLQTASAAYQVALEEVKMDSVVVV